MKARGAKRARKHPMLLDQQVVRVTKEHEVFGLPRGALGQVIHSGIGAKAKMWYGVRFLCQQNPHGFMDLTMWEGEIRGLTKREAGHAK